MEYNFSDRLKDLGGNAIREIFKLLSDPEVISFAGGFPTVSTLPVEIVKQLAVEVLSGENAGAILQYGATEGYRPFVDILPRYVSRYGIYGINSDNILIVSGGQQSIDLTMKAFINKGDVILVEEPTYLACLHIAKTYEAKTIGVKSNENGLDVDDLQAKIKQYHPKLLYLVPTFSNPTGRTIPSVNRKRIAEMTAAAGVMVLEDDPYSELRFDGQRVPSIKSFDTAGNVIFSFSFSKTISPSMRVAVAIGNKEVIRKLTIGKQATDVHSNTLSQAVIAKYLTAGYMDKRLPTIIPLYREKRDAMLQAIDKYMPKCFKHTIPDG